MKVAHVSKLLLQPRTLGNIEVTQLIIGGANKKLDALKTQLNDDSEQMNQLRKKVKK